MNTKNFKVVGYLSNWINFLDKAKQLDFHKITHLLIAFVNPINTNADLEYVPDLKEVVNIAHDNNTKVFISLGGAIINEEVWKYLQEKENRPLFIEKIISFVQEYNLDGIDIDLEANNIGENYSAFVQELSIQIHLLNKEISGALAPWVSSTVPDEAIQSFDFINMMAYDETGTWSPEKQIQHSSFEKAVNDIIYWNETRNIPLDKLVLGLPFYGYSFNNYTYPPSSLFYTYEQIIEHFPDATHEDQMNFTDKHIVFYNGKDTIREKTLLAIEKKLGGVMLWELAFDAKGKKSLLNEVNDVLKENNILFEKQNPAIFKARWIFARVIIEKDRTDFLQNDLLPFIEKASAENHLKDWVYTISNPNELLLFIKTTAFASESWIKPTLEKAFSSQLTEYKGYYLMDWGYYGISTIITKLFSKSTDLLYPSIKEATEWNHSTTMSIAIPLQLILAQTFEKDLTRMTTFFQNFVNRTIDAIAQTKENPIEWKENSMQQLITNFEQQKEGFLGFCDFILQQIEEKQFEEEYLNDWFATCEMAYTELLQIQEKDKIVMRADFVPNPNSVFSIKEQERWTLLEQFIYVLDGQLNLDPLTACSIYYAIGQSLPLLITENV